MRLAIDVELPAVHGTEGHAGERSYYAEQTIKETRGMQARLPQAHRLVQPVNRERRVHVMQLVSRGTHFPDCLENPLFFLKTSDYEIFYRHDYYLFND